MASVNDTLEQGLRRAGSTAEDFTRYVAELREHKKQSAAPVSAAAVAAGASAFADSLSPPPSASLRDAPAATVEQARLSIRRSAASLRSAARSQPGSPRLQARGVERDGDDVRSTTSSSSSRSSASGSDGEGRRDYLRRHTSQADLDGDSDQHSASGSAAASSYLIPSLAQRAHRKTRRRREQDVSSSHGSHRPVSGAFGASLAISASQYSLASGSVQGAGFCTCCCGKADCPNALRAATEWQDLQEDLKLAAGVSAPDLCAQYCRPLTSFVAPQKSAKLF